MAIEFVWDPTGSIVMVLLLLCPLSLYAITVRFVFNSLSRFATKYPFLKYSISYRKGIVSPSSNCSTTTRVAPSILDNPISTSTK